MGFCQSCGEHAPLVEAPAASRASHGSWMVGAESKPQELSTVSKLAQERVLLAPGEVNRVLGGGLVPGSVVLMAGEPGIGKSTLLLQLANSMASGEKRVIYVTGEESVHQIKLRSDRLGVKGGGIYVLPETNLDEVMAQLQSCQPSLVVVDSIQTLYAEEAGSTPGSVAQVKACALRLMQWAKASSVPVWLAGHMTKDGSLAGPRVLEHMVDVVLYLEGENLNSYRILRSAKNRFGSIDEVGIFQMTADGMQEVSDPSKILISERNEGAIGSAVVPILEGSRPLLVEVQALTSPSILPVPRRIANGIDYNRLLMLSAVLTKRAGLNLSNQDIIVNVVGGLRIKEPASDLSVALAIASSLRNSPVVPGLVGLGEVGLSGELRRVPQLQRRLNEASRLGFHRCLLPNSAKDEQVEVDGTKVVYVSTISQALRQCLSTKKSSKPAGLEDDDTDQQP